MIFRLFGPQASRCNSPDVVMNYSKVNGTSLLSKCEDADQFCPRNVVCYISGHTIRKAHTVNEFRNMNAIQKNLLKCKPT